jgi:hypothetical protein
MRPFALVLVLVLVPVVGCVPPPGKSGPGPAVGHPHARAGKAPIGPGAVIDGSPQTPRAGPGASGPPAAAAGASRETDRWIEQCAAFRVNTEDGAGSLPDACRRLVKHLADVTQRCRATGASNACFAAGLMHLGNVPTTIAMSLRLPKRLGFAQETIQLQERIANPNQAQGAALINQACQGGHAGACELQTLAKLPGYEAGFRRNVLANLCREAASPGACASWAYDVTGSRMKSEDDGQVLASAREVLTSACQDGGVRSCGNLAVVELMFDDDAPAASRWAAEACTLGAGDPRLDGRGIACSNLVTMRLHRPAFKRLKADWGSAVTVLRDACDRGDQSACVRVAHAMEAGLGMKKNRRAAKATLKNLCRSGARDACR